MLARWLDRSSVISPTPRSRSPRSGREFDRPDAIFRDPLAPRLAGERGQRIAARLRERLNNDWAIERA
jgi:hypothetical protein